MASSAQHVHQQRLAEAARADEEEILVAGLNLGDEAALIDIVAVVEAHGLPVLHPVGDAFWCLCSHSLQICCKVTKKACKEQRILGRLMKSGLK